MEMFHKKRCNCFKSIKYAKKAKIYQKIFPKQASVKGRTPAAAFGKNVRGSGGDKGL